MQQTHPRPSHSLPFIKARSRQCYSPGFVKGEKNLSQIRGIWTDRGVPSSARGFNLLLALCVLRFRGKYRFEFTIWHIWHIPVRKFLK